MKRIFSHGLNGFNGLGAFDNSIPAPNPLNPFNPWLKILTVLSLLGLVWGCKVGPTYKTPTAPVTSIFEEPLPSNWKTATPQDGTLRGDWWTMFGDSQLNALEKQVDISNQNVAV